MRIKEHVLYAIKGNKNLKHRLADALGVNIHVIYRWVRLNSDNLTKAAALKVIREDLKLTDQEILEEVVYQGA